MKDLTIIQKTYDLIKWYVPILNRLPRNHKFILGERMTKQLYDILEGLIEAKFCQNKAEKLEKLQKINVKLEILRHQTRLILDYHHMNTERYEYVSKLINEIGLELGGWIKHQSQNKNIA
jgi:23S rRNA-intervening sequence protein